MEAHHRGTSPGVAPARRARHRLVAAAIGVLVAGAAALGIPAPATDRVQTTGDEPHYLLTAEALGRHGSLDLSEAYEQGRHRPFFDASLAPQGAPLADGRLLAPHDPLLPALLALPMRLGGWVAAKAALAVMAGMLAGVLVWTASTRLGVPWPAAASVTSVLLVAPPLATYGSQVYPELPAALAVAVAVAALAGPLRGVATAVLVTAVVALPWLSVKHIPVAAVLAAVGLVRVWRRGATRQALTVVALLVLAAVVYVAAHLAWYGGLTVYAAGEFFQRHGGELSVVGTSPDYLGRSLRLVGLLIDAEFGLAAWQPAWLLLVPAAAALAGSRRPDGHAPEAGDVRWLLLAPLAAGWLVATFVAATMHGWWFPGRHVLAVLPAGVLAMAWWAGQHRARLLVLVVLAAVGVLAHLWLVVEGWRGDLGLVVGFLDTTNPLYAWWSSLLPAYRQVTGTTWLLHAVWLLGLTGLAWSGWRARVA